MGFTIKQAQPVNDRLLIALAGPQASGKTTSALRLATGITSVTGGKICLIDTENKRALRYASNFNFNHVDFEPPFSPARYLEAIKAVESQGYGDGDVIIIDSTSHEHEGVGGVLEMHENFLQEKCGNDWKKREKLKFTAWIKPKAERTRTIQMGISRSRAHIILCFRAKEKVAMVKGQSGKAEVVNAGWQPIGGDEYFYEMDITMMLPLGAAGKPDWNEKASRINEIGDGPLKNLLHNTQQISEQTGSQLAQISMKALSEPKNQQQQADQSKHHDDDPIKQLAKDILSDFARAYNSEDLQAKIDFHFEDLKEVKKSSQSAYDEIMARVKKRMNAFIAEGK